MLNCINELISFLNGAIPEINVVVMPDFFLDRLITLETSPTEFAKTITDIASRKGGSIDGILQIDIRGGNAVNTASALAALGAKVAPIVCTSEFGLEHLKFYLKNSEIDFSHVKVLSKSSLTTALELAGTSNRANVMLRDLGSLEDFGFGSLTETDYSAIEEADYVCVFNWAGTRNYGTELANRIFRLVKNRGIGKTYIDTADPSPNREQIPNLIENVLKTNLVDILSVNENEAVTYASFLDREFSQKKKESKFEELVQESARVLAKSLLGRIDLHTTNYSATFTKEEEIMVPAFRIEPLRATGAGDSWNAGNIFADANGLSDSCRLALANSVSAYYLRNPEGAHPTRKQLAKFLQKQKANLPASCTAKHN